jgi:tRNA pseudouridine38-40 synthase
VVGASRTDAGVHALGQVASVESPEPLAPATVAAALNARLPRDIRALAARAAPESFDARRAARLKRYGYLLATDRVPSPFLRGFAWHVGRALDVRAMGQAAAALRGKHDFSAFCAAPGRDRDPVCRVHAVRVVARRARIGVLMSADAFLHHMVRNVVGTLVEVGLGRRPPRWVAEVLAGRDRRLGGPTAPPEGLCLLCVRYPWSLFPGGRHAAESPTRD